MNVLVRAFTGAAAGLLSVLATALVWMAMSTGSCRFEEPYETHSAHCDGMAAYAILWQPLLVLACLAGTATLHVWLLDVRHEPRQGWVVAPGLCLVVLLAPAVWSWGVAEAFLLVPSVAFALAGALTGIRSADLGQESHESR
ncbi:hypothetical protein [Lentzea aerocolonigenes]|uniref:hypothetical protein n=1 Tax=Lentzea aerocolonigenes TaxID=68170 RepID=UPI000AF7E218|nr:hypothetical protein [Lentzea aerocolonigenes]MCP2250281.1 hypothetical protein [Lentzea aerocolonigenes]